MPISRIGEPIHGAESAILLRRASTQAEYLPEIGRRQDPQSLQINKTKDTPSTSATARVMSSVVQTPNAVPATCSPALGSRHPCSKHQTHACQYVHNRRENTIQVTLPMPAVQWPCAWQQSPAKWLLFETSRVISGPTPALERAIASRSTWRV